MTAITGNTYPVKDKLRALGGRWDPEKKAWMVPNEKAQEAQALVAQSPNPSRLFRPSKCQVCGTLPTRHNPIYRSGECRDCFEERKMGY